MLFSINDLQNKSYKDIILIDARSSAKYSSGHIPNAINLDLFSFHWFDTTIFGIKYFYMQLNKIFSYIGVSNKKNVVFYDDISGMLAARGVWLLTCLSHPNVFMLDGGLTQWKKKNLPLERKPNHWKYCQYKGKFNNDVITGYRYIVNNINKIKILDSRSKEEYTGKLIRTSRGGHIPTSSNVDWRLNLTTDGKFKNNLNLTKLYNLNKNDNIVTYCHGAYRAANTFVALKHLGFSSVKVYLGSWLEWGNKLELPIE